MMFLKPCLETNYPSKWKEEKCHSDLMINELENCMIEAQINL